jgi:hypothetical protein
MKSYGIEDLALFAGRTSQGFPYIVAGCLASCPRAEAERALEAAMDRIVWPACSPRKLDIVLAEALRKVSGKFAVIGATIAVPDIAGQGGGVLGDPGQDSRSAEGLEEWLPGGWKLLTFPGGPGIACQGASAGELTGGIDDLTELADGKQLLLGLAEIAAAAGLDKMVAITDGSGAGSEGAAMILHHQEFVVLSLAEV